MSVMRVQVAPPTENKKNEKVHARKAAVVGELGFTWQQR